MTISFDTILGDIRKPGQYLEFNTRMAVRTLPGNLQTMLIVAPMLTGALAEPLALPNVFSDDEAAALFGAGSLAHLMARAAIQANEYLQLQIIGIAEHDAGQAATGSLVLTGPATGNGSLSLWVSDIRLDVAINARDNVDAIYAAVVTAINAKNLLPITAAVTNTEDAGKQITLTAKQKGAFGNDILLRAMSNASGVTVSVSALVGGQNNPDIQPALDAVFAAGHNIIAAPYSDQATLTALRTHLEKTGGAMEQRGAVGSAGWPGSLSTGVTLSGQINDGRTSLAWYPGSRSLAGVIAAAYGAVIASEADPARPLNTLALTGLDITPLTARSGRNEQENALHNGLTPIEVGPGDKVQIVRAVTTYTRNPQNVVDTALLDLTTIRTLDYTRKACRERIALRFPRDKLHLRTRAKVKSELLDVLLKLEDEEILENVMANKDKLLVEFNNRDPNRLDAVIPADVVNGLHVFAGRVDLYL
ncbi:MAG: phage tail sheath subtilisin-like domain-containing protein [Plesiomonas sp.]|uniref:phage tail sheath subtilisin-like domain-containing protein n=1 Tax=Plesiomonas sp. TaxID=2486279 RepID=UPI003F3A2295